MELKRGGVAAMQIRPGLRWKAARRRSCAAELPNGNTEPLRLVGEVVLDSRAREMHDADRQEFEHGVVALERCRLGVLRPVRLENDLWHLAGSRPFGSDQPAQGPARAVCRCE